MEIDLIELRKQQEKTRREREEKLKKRKLGYDHPQSFDGISVGNSDQSNFKVRGWIENSREVDFSDKRNTYNNRIHNNRNDFDIQLNQNSLNVSNQDFNRIDRSDFHRGYRSNEQSIVRGNVNHFNRNDGYNNHNKNNYNSFHVSQEKDWNDNNRQNNHEFRRERIDDKNDFKFCGRNRSEGHRTTEIDEIMKNDYSQHFVDSGERPQNFVRDASMTDRFEEYPILKDLLQKKDELINLRNTQPFYMNADLKELDLLSFGTPFDVILIDPPLEEYYLRSLERDQTEAKKEDEKCPFWTIEELEKLNIPAISANPCFLFLWTGNGGEGLEMGRRLLKKWGFRRSEDIVWVKTNKENPHATPLREKGATFIRTKEHCLMGIKGSVRRNIDAHIIHSNIDTDVIIAEEPRLGSTRKPEELYSIIEHFCLGRRRLELFGEDHNIRPGWVTVGDKILSSNWDKDLYHSYFESVSIFGNLLGTTHEIETLRPRSPSRDDSKLIFYNRDKKIPSKGPPDRDLEV